MLFEAPVSTSALERALARSTEGTTASALVAAIVPSPVGPLVAAASDDGLCLLEFGAERRLAHQLDGMLRVFGPVRMGDHPMLERTRVELGEYFAGARTRFEIPLVIRGTPFQELVWRALLEIPFGETTSYGELARSLGRPGAQRAVGLANGQNRQSILIPCHRVVEKGGGLRGYGGGLWRKRFLLDLERRAVGADPLADTPLGRAGA